jgi:hypothetical protein
MIVRSIRWAAEHSNGATVGTEQGDGVGTEQGDGAAAGTEHGNGATASATQEEVGS